MNITDTSRAAAPSPSQAANLREQCLLLLQQANFTADEIAMMIKKSILSIRPRIAELKAEKSVFDSGERRQNASGHNAIVWTTKQPFTLES